MFKTIKSLHPQDKDLPQRSYDNLLLKAVLDGTLYDPLTTPFNEEKSRAGEYIPLKNRRPSARYNLCKVVVQDAISMLFGEGRFPTLECTDRQTRDTLTDLIKESRLGKVLIDAATKGSVGSVAVLMRVLRGRVFFDSVETTYLTPVYDPEEPDTLLSVTQKYKVSGADLAASGYDIPADQLRAIFWVQRVWDTDSDTFYLPWLVKTVDDKPVVPVVDMTRTKKHGLGFVPLVWVTNLPGGDDIDGACTFEAAIDTQIQIEYLLSQGVRALNYASDPTLIVREPAMSEGQMVGGAGNALILDKDGDAKLLEIGGTATQALIEMVRTLREFALESIHGNRTAPDKMSLPQSGRAMEMLNAPLVSLADNLRTSYGENGLLPLLKMVIRASKVFPLKLMGQAMPTLSDMDKLSLRWPNFFPDCAADKNQQATTLQVQRAAGLVSRETAVAILATNNNVEDIPAELARIEADIVADDARAAALGAQVKEVSNLPD